MNLAFYGPSQKAASGGDYLNSYLLQGLAQHGCHITAKNTLQQKSAADETALVDGILWQQIKQPIAKRQIAICHGPISGQEREFYHRCHGVVFVSKALADKAKQLFGPMNQSFVLDAAAWQFPWKQRFPKKELRLAQIGRWDENKGQLQLVAGMEDWHRRKPAFHWHLTLVGNKDHNTLYSEKVMSIVKRLPENRVTILGEIPPSKLTNIYQQIDVVIVSSQYESLSLVALEAASHGALVLAWGRGGIRRLIAQGAGLLLSKPEELPKILGQLYYQREYLRRLQQRSYRFAARLPTWDKESSRLMTWLDTQSQHKEL